MHWAGTMRMGHTHADAVVDLHGKVHGTSNLYVADASVFPNVGVANPMLTISAWAYRVAKNREQPTTRLPRSRGGGSRVARAVRRVRR